MTGIDMIRLPYRGRAGAHPGLMTGKVGSNAGEYSVRFHTASSSRR
jgi:hypothetical protein